MNALGRKGRSRAKRDAKLSARQTFEDDSIQNQHNQPKQPFVNVGLQRWKKEREEWTAKSATHIPKRTPPPKPSEREVDAELLYTAILDASSDPLPRQVPLAELILILQQTRELVA